MKRTITLTSVTLLTAACVTFALAQAPAPPGAASPSVQQEEVAHHKAAMEAEVAAHHKAAAIAHHKVAAAAHHKAVMENEEAAHQKAAPANPGNQ